MTHSESKADAADDRGPESLKETLISIIIAFALAFVGRSYVIEPFIIPTGSMAPTLMGAHMRFDSPYSGFDWSANPRDGVRQGKPLRVQGARDTRQPIQVVDPLSHIGMSRFDVPLFAGDRILVLKYLYALLEPRRFDVVVFKNPENPQENFIKRLIGLPGEEIWLSDGDLFVREPGSDDPNLQRWRIQRKPRRVQEEVWWPVFSSEYRPLTQTPLNRRWRGPWSGDGWDTKGASYRADTDLPGDLVWDGDLWPITDWTPYNDPVAGLFRHVGARMPISDVRMRLAVEPDAPGLATTATLVARQHEFQCVIADGRAQIRMRRVGEESWTVLDSAAVKPFKPGRASDVEFIHVDQSLELRIDGRRIAYGRYDWSPQERLAWSTTEYANRDRGLPLIEPASYRRPKVSWSFAGSPVTLHRVGLDRDLYWRTTANEGETGYARATSAETTFLLEKDQFFMCGDNSPASRDSRLWSGVDPWVAATLEDRPGVVPRTLMMGKAFFVYFPSPYRNLGRIPVPDFGRLRFIK